MLAKDLISEIVPALKTSDTGRQALTWMEAFRVSHLPIVNNHDFLGLISDADIYDLNAVDEPLGNHRLSLISPYVYRQQHVYDVIEIAARLKLTLVPVLDANKAYCGVITQSELIQHFSDLIAAAAPGGIIELEMDARDYAFSEIARLVEDANAKILSLYASQSSEASSVKVTIKLNRTDLQGVLNAFERYGYKVKASYMGEAHINDSARRNYESLMRYLDV